MTRERFAAVMATLSVLPGKDVSAPLLEVYWRVLGDLNDEEMEAGATKALRTCRFLPTPAELLELARPRNLQAEAGKVFEQIRELSDYAAGGEYWKETKIRIALGNEAADAFVACGGSAAFRSGDPVWTRKAFVEAYCNRPPRETPPALPESPKAKRMIGSTTDADPKVLDLTRRIGRTLPPDFKARASGDDTE